MTDGTHDDELATSADEGQSSLNALVMRPTGLLEIKDLRNPVRIKRAVKDMKDYMGSYHEQPGYSQYRMQTFIKDMKDYMENYHEQPGYSQYRMQTFIDDVLYGLGLAIDPSIYHAGNGFDKFKEDLKKYLDV